MKTRIPMKLLAALMALCLLLSLGAFSAMAEEDLGSDVDQAVVQAGTLERALASGLAFDGVGSQFKILVMNDFNDGLIPYPAMLKYIQCVVADTEPDLIVLNGDLTRKGVSTAMMNWAVVPWVIDLLGCTPYTLTFGDRDALISVSKNHYLSNYQRRGKCLAFDDAPVINGVANHNLFIFNDAGAAAGKDIADVAFNLFMMDSNKDGLYRTQSSWYGIKEELILDEAGYIVPSMLFTHKPLPEIANTPGGAGLKGLPRNWYEGEDAFSMNMFERMEKYEGVQAAVSGHYPGNSFNQPYTAGEYSMSFIQCPGMTFLSCSNTNRDTRGATLITLQLNGLGAPADPGTPAVMDGLIEVTPAVPPTPAVAPDVEIIAVDPIPAFANYFDDGADMQKFYKAGVNWLFGPLSSLIGLVASIFANKYEVTFKVTQFFGNVFGFML